MAVLAAIDEGLVVAAIVVGVLALIPLVGRLVGTMVRTEMESELGPDDAARPATEKVEAGWTRADETEVRDLLEAKAYRQRQRGEDPIDVDAELARLLGRRRAARGGEDEPA
jgi:hypothetical protein